MSKNKPTLADEDRRRFLASCGKFAAVTPPAITMLLSTSMNSEAIAKSGGGNGNHRSHGHGHGKGGHHGNNGYGNGGGDGSPNWKDDRYR